LLEKLFRFLKEALADGRFMAVQQSGKFLQLGPLFGIQPRRHFHLHTDVQIAVAVALKIFHAVAFDAERRAGLRSCRNFASCSKFNFASEEIFKQPIFARKSFNRRSASFRPFVLSERRNYLPLRFNKA